MFQNTNQWSSNPSQSKHRSTKGTQSFARSCAERQTLQNQWQLWFVSWALQHSGSNLESNCEWLWYDICHIYVLSKSEKPSSKNANRFMTSICFSNKRIKLQCLFLLWPRYWLEDSWPIKPESHRKTAGTVSSPNNGDVFTQWCCTKEVTSRTCKGGDFMIFHGQIARKHGREQKLWATVAPTEG